MSGEGSAKFNRVVGTFVPGLLALGGGVVSGIGQRQKTLDGNASEWSVACGIFLSLAPTFLSFKTEKAMADWRKNVSNRHFRAAAYDLAVQPPAPAGRIFKALEHAPIAARKKIRSRKGTWNLGAAAGAWCGVLAFQAIPGNWGGAVASAVYMPLLGASFGALVDRLVPGQKDLQKALTNYKTCFDAGLNAPVVDPERDFPKLQELAEAICEVSFKNSGKILAAVATGATSGLVMGAALGHAARAESISSYLLATLPTAAGLLVTFSKCYAEALNSIFTGEEEKATVHSVEAIDIELQRANNS